MAVRRLLEKAAPLEVGWKGEKMTVLDGETMTRCLLALVADAEANQAAMAAELRDLRAQLHDARRLDDLDVRVEGIAKGLIASAVDKVRTREAALDDRLQTRESDTRTAWTQHDEPRRTTTTATQTNPADCLPNDDDASNEIQEAQEPTAGERQTSPSMIHAVVPPTQARSKEEEELTTLELRALEEASGGELEGRLGGLQQRIQMRRHKALVTDCAMKATNGDLGDLGTKVRALEDRVDGVFFKVRSVEDELKTKLDAIDAADSKKTIDDIHDAIHAGKRDLMYLRTRVDVEHRDFRTKIMKNAAAVHHPLGDEKNPAAATTTCLMCKRKVPETSRDVVTMLNLNRDFVPKLLVDLDDAIDACRGSGYRVPSGARPRTAPCGGRQPSVSSKDDPHARRRPSSPILDSHAKPPGNHHLSRSATSLHGRFEPRRILKKKHLNVPPRKQVNAVLLAARTRNGME